MPPALVGSLRALFQVPLTFIQIHSLRLIWSLEQFKCTYADYSQLCFQSKPSSSIAPGTAFLLAEIQTWMTSKIEWHFNRRSNSKNSLWSYLLWLGPPLSGGPEQVMSRGRLGTIETFLFQVVLKSLQFFCLLNICALLFHCMPKAFYPCTAQLLFNIMRSYPEHLHLVFHFFLFSYMCIIFTCIIFLKNKYITIAVALSRGGSFIGYQSV